MSIACSLSHAFLPCRFQLSMNIITRLWCSSPMDSLNSKRRVVTEYICWCQPELKLWNNSALGQGQCIRSDRCRLTSTDRQNHQRKDYHPILFTVLLQTDPPRALFCSLFSLERIALFHSTRPRPGIVTCENPTCSTQEAVSRL